MSAENFIFIHPGYEACAGCPMTLKTPTILGATLAEVKRRNLGETIKRRGQITRVLLENPQLNCTEVRGGFFHPVPHSVKGIASFDLVYTLSSRNNSRVRKPNNKVTVDGPFVCPALASAE